MKNVSLIFVAAAAICFFCTQKSSREKSANAIDSASNTNPVALTNSKHLFLDVHNLEPGKVKFEDVAAAHQKDVATQGKFNTEFIKYWVDEMAGKVYCLVEAPDSAAVFNTHKEAHGLTPDLVRLVSDGVEASGPIKNSLFLDIHQLGAGNVTAADVAGAHEKDLAVQRKYGVSFINYWVDEKLGTVVCLSDAKDSQAIVNTHKEAHGLLPGEIHKVRQGQ